MTAIEFNSQLISQRGPLKNLAYQLTLNRDDAQDLVQETMLKAVMYRDKFVDATNLKGWLYTIMKNTFINSYRRSVKGRFMVRPTDDIATIKAASGFQNMNSESDLNEKQINKAIESLSDEYKIPFNRFVEGYKYNEIAEELSLPIGTVKSRIFLARKALMTQLKEFAA